MKYPMIIDGVRLVVDVEPYDAALNGKPKFLIRSVTGTADSISELLKSEVWGQIEAQARAALEFQEACRRPDEAARRCLNCGWHSRTGLPHENYCVGPVVEDSGSASDESSPTLAEVNARRGHESEDDNYREPDMLADGPAEREHRQDKARRMK
jgi:hypothetical protein